MSDPKLTYLHVKIQLECDDGYESARVFDSERPSNRPKEVALGALEELARLTALYGLEDEALTVFNAARERVSAFKASRKDTDK